MSIGTRKKPVEFKPLYGDGRIREHDEGATKKLEKDYRKWLNKEYFPCKFPLCCETCKFVGNAWWHCHNEKSHKCYINVNPDDVCEGWQPNEGLLIYLWIREMNKKE